MCGIVGVVGNIDLKEKDMFKMLLKLDTVRGPHSTGVLSVDVDGKEQHVKRIGTPWELMEYQDFEDTVFGPKRVLLGHNRYATKGVISEQNAHPFKFENVVGVHNGTLKGQYLLDDSKDFEVDSENIYHHMNENGVEDTISKLDGAYCLSWYNTKERTFNLVRNDERPMSLCYNSDKTCVFFASEAWMLNVASAKTFSKTEEIWTLAHDKLCTWKLPENNKDIMPIEAEVTDVKVYQRPVYPLRQLVPHGRAIKPKKGLTEDENNLDSYLLQAQEVVFLVDCSSLNHYKIPYIKCRLIDPDLDVEIRIHAVENGPQWNNLIYSPTKFRGIVKSVTNFLGKPYLLMDLRSIKEEYANPIGEDGLIITKKEFENKTKQGCGWCGHVPEVEEDVSIYWLGNGDFLCGSCEKDNVLENLM